MAANWRRLGIIILSLWFLTDITWCSTWSEWWTYDGISGPQFWGLLNPEWVICSKGRKQSPIDIVPRDLLYDPNMKHVHVNKHRIGGILVNTGHEVKVILDDPSTYYVNITGGPLAYNYRINEILLHFGSDDTRGSEHTIDGQPFPAEIQLLGYNSDIYFNISHAERAANGLAILAILVQIGKKPNEEFELISQNVREVRYKGRQVRIRHLSVHGLLPTTDDYMTYEGSLTQPGCHESVTWILMNKPTYITAEQLQELRTIMQGDEKIPKVPMSNNFRTIMPLNERAIRTNINVPNQGQGCTMEKRLHYKANVMAESTDER